MGCVQSIQSLLPVDGKTSDGLALQQRGGPGDQYYKYQAEWSEVEASPELSQTDKRRIAGFRNNEYTKKMRFIEGVPLFKTLPKDQFPIVALVCNRVTYPKGSLLIEQGDVGDAFYIIISGEAQVQVYNERGKREKLGALKPGDYFGEAALLWDEVRAATISAQSDLSAYEIKREDFQRLKLNEKLQFATRQAVAASGGSSGSSAHPPTPKTRDEIMLIAKAIKSNTNLSTIATLDESRMGSFIDAMWKEEVPLGKAIIKAGDFNAEHFYVVQAGSFEISSNGMRGQRSAELLIEQDSNIVVGRGGSFGELALLYLAPRSATVRAREKSIVWVIDRQSFKKILVKVCDSKLDEYVRYLDGVASMHCLLSDEKREVAKALVEMRFKKNDAIIRQGEPGNNFYILYDGAVKILKDGEELSRLSASADIKEAHYFGESALLADDLRNATVVVTSDTARCLGLDRETFNLLLGPLKDIIDTSKKYPKIGGVSKRQSFVGRGMNTIQPAPLSYMKRKRIFRKDLVRVGLLGVGSCSVVELWEHTLSKETYAVKMVGKGFLMRTKMQDVVLNEKDIFMRVDSPFIIKLIEAYNGAQSLYFLLELALGGELYTTYHRKDLYGSVRHARYYLAGCVLALEHMHERKIIYRDLKPENVLLNSEGHLKLTDMGLAKFVIGKTYSTCGTPDYFAPEMILSVGHDCSLDWWALGIFLYELMTGRTPFASHFPMQIYRKVQKGIHKVRFPSKCQGDVANLVRNLLVNEPADRLPMRPGGVDNIKNHKWYSDFNWDLMQNLELEPPYMPVVLHNKDMSNFNARPDDVPTLCTYYDPGNGWDKDFATA